MRASANGYHKVVRTLLDGGAKEYVNAKSKVRNQMMMMIMMIILKVLTIMMKIEMIIYNYDRISMYWC